ncbi:MAG TPA: DUF1320 family protein [Candidatus Contendobacter sp.]|nr:DUF1320 family protein [Candidatus Contendobacter sp.]
MSYATLDDLERRYPGELTQAGPQTGGALDEEAVERALSAADDPINRTLRTLQWTTVPVAAPVPDWIITLAVDIALYLATPTVLASQEEFKDRRKRYETALATLADLAAGRLLPATSPGESAPASPAFRAPERVFTPAALGGF